MITFSVPGIPRGKERVGQDPRSKGGKGHRFAANKSADIERGIGYIARKAMASRAPITGAVKLTFLAIFPIPPSWPPALKAAALEGRVFHTQKPDKDNIEKLIWDALKGVCWHDDSQVMGGGLKRFGQPARIDVWIEELSAPGDTPPPETPSEQRRITVGNELALGAVPAKRLTHNAPKKTAIARPFRGLSR